MPEMSQQQQSFNISARPEDAMGHYANFVGVTSQERDVVIDFASVVKIGNGPAQGQLVSRVFLNRFVAQDLLNVLKANLEQWEKMRYEQGEQGQKPQA
jgi:hypothetical protein